MDEISGFAVANKSFGLINTTLISVLYRARYFKLPDTVVIGFHNYLATSAPPVR